MRILIRTSRLAVWARRFASLAVPLIVLSLVLHRTGLISSASFEIVILMGGAAAALAVLLAILSFIRLWWTGDQGWGRALAAFIIGLVCLAPFGYFGLLAREAPPVLDVATTWSPPIALQAAAPRDPPGEAQLAALNAAFPSATTRRYPLDAAQVFLVIDQLAQDRGWLVLSRSAPEGEGGRWFLNALDTRLLGWRDEVAVLVSGDLTSAVVDMRSAAVAGTFDFGANGGRIESFLAELDKAIGNVLRDNPAGIELPEDEPAAPVPGAPATTGT